MQEDGPYFVNGAIFEGIGSSSEISHKIFNTPSATNNQIDGFVDLVTNNEQGGSIEANVVVGNGFFVSKIDVEDIIESDVSITMTLWKKTYRWFISAFIYCSLLFRV